MTKKRLGRGLDDISDVFLTKNQDTESKKSLNPLPSFKTRDQTCDTCVNFILAGTEPTCRIFTFDYERYNVPYAETVKLSDAHHCEYYSSSKPKNSDGYVKTNPSEAYLSDIECEINENIHIDKEFVFRDDKDSQKGIRKIIFEHLEDGYEIRRIELRKTDKNLTLNRKDTKALNVCISVKED